MSKTSSNRIVWLVGGLIVLVVVVLFARFFPGSGVSAEEQREAKEALMAMGAIVVMDGSQQHVATVNLSSLKQPAEPANSDASSGTNLDKAVELLKSLPSLTALTASNTAFDDSHAEIVGTLKQLESLTLNETQITDAGLSHFEGLVKVESLSLLSTKVTGAGLAPIGKMSSIKVLDLSSTKVTGGLSPLVELGNLDWLVLRFLELEDGSLAPLAECQALNKISLEDTTVSQETVAAFKSKRPEVTVEGQ